MDAPFAPPAGIPRQQGSPPLQRHIGTSARRGVAVHVCRLTSGWASVRPPAGSCAARAAGMVPKSGAVSRRCSGGSRSSSRLRCATASAAACCWARSACHDGRRPCESCDLILCGPNGKRSPLGGSAPW
jgi:hypothetical protein